jgi:hypothetical protein
MIGPEIAARWLLWALGIGAALGTFYGFLRPAPEKLRPLWDLFFVCAAFYGWIYLGFGICGGDLRFGCTAAMASGGILWDQTAGRLLAPLFSRFWAMIGKIFYLFRKVVKIFFKKVHNFANFLLASGKKWFKIIWLKSSKPFPGGTSYGKKKRTCQTGVQKIKSHHQGRPAGSRGAVHRRPGDAARLYPE